LVSLFYKSDLLYRIGCTLRPFIENLFKVNIVYGEPLNLDESSAFIIENACPSIFINRKIPRSKRKDIIRDIIKKLNREGFEAKSSEELYGVYYEDFPDIFIVTDEVHIVKGSGKEIKAKFNRGFHSRNGLFAIKAPGIKPRRLNIRLIDLAPTILDIFDIGSPTDMEGKSIFGGIKKVEPLYAQSERQKIVKTIKKLKGRIRT